MTNIQIILEGDDCWPDLANLQDGHLFEATITAVALLPDAAVTNVITGEHRTVPSVNLRIQLPDGAVAIAQMKLEMFETIARTLRGRMDFLAQQAASAHGVEA